MQGLILLVADERKAFPCNKIVIHQTINAKNVLISQLVALLEGAPPAMSSPPTLIYLKCLPL
jgi:hypothetical protein